MSPLQGEIVDGPPPPRRRSPPRAAQAPRQRAARSQPPERGSRAALHFLLDRTLDQRPELISAVDLLLTGVAEVIEGARALPVPKRPAPEPPVVRVVEP